MRARRLSSLMFLIFLSPLSRSYCENTKNVLVLHMENSHVPANIAASNAIQEVLGSQPKVQIFEEYLDENRLGTDFATRADLFGHKYSGQHIDLVLSVGPPAFQFILQYGDQLWPLVPKVFSAVNGKPAQVPDNVTGVYGFFRVTPTLDLALHLQPEIQHVFFVGGSTPAEVALRAVAQNEFHAYAGHIDFAFLTDKPLSALLDELSRLPPHSAVIFTTFFKDATGQTFVSANVAQLVAVASNAPVYGLLQTFMGSGIIGGSVFDFETQARAGADLGRKILLGVPIATLPIREGPRNEIVVDWRQLKRWDISMARVPPGTIVMFREPTVWQRYRGYIWVVIGLMVGQSVLVILLLVQVRARQASNVAIRGLTRKLISAGEDERKHIASELHDDIGQRLSLVYIELDSTMAGLRRDGKNEHDLGNCLNEVDALITDVHNLSHQLHSSKLQHLGLESALKELCRNIEERHKLKVELEIQGVSRDLHPDLSLCFYRIAQEGLSNAVRHSGASRVHVSVKAMNGQITMIVKDYGHGFQADTSPAGLGLVIMQERLLNVSGTFSVSSTRDSGTTLTASAPLLDAA
jgi:signal transduction histidine kinase